MKFANGPPLSRAAGTSGSCGARWSPSTANARRALPLICPITGPRISTPTSTSPLRSALMTGGVPLKGTTWASMPAVVLNNSAARFWVVPTCGVPMLSLPGLARAHASNSASVLNRPPSATTSTRSKVASMDTGAKSASVSNGSDLNSAALTAVPLDTSSSVWPSGSARATSSPATTPPAPGLLSTTTGWPRAAAIFWPTVRAVRSAAPPGALGTTIRSGLAGKACARAGQGMTAAASGDEYGSAIRHRHPLHLTRDAEQAIQQLGMVAQFGGRAGMHHGAAIEHHGAVRDRQDRLRMLLDDDRREPLLARDARDGAQQLLAR